MAGNDDRSERQVQADAQLSRLASLGEPIRRLLYRFVASQSEPVSREQAAAGVEVAHHVAKFHLDKLEGDGLLEVEYRRPAGRSGPGAGRPAKFYRRSRQEIAVTLPERHYDLAGQLMADAISRAQASGRPVRDTLRAAAKAAGGTWADRPDHQPPSRPGTRRDQTDQGTDPELITRICEVLSDNGYEPHTRSGCITLDNCPFHALAERHTDLVCAMNLDLITGYLDALDQDAVRAGLDPAAGRCCVTITPTKS